MSLPVSYFPLTSLPSQLSSYLSRNKCLITFLVFLAFSSLECKMEMFKCMPITHTGIFTFPHPCWVHPCQCSSQSSIPPCERSSCTSCVGKELFLQRLRHAVIYSVKSSEALPSRRLLPAVWFYLPFCFPLF